jgi:ribulose-5-phosphate 4-epimerase/fuculose-1-phosphate aldolase
MTSTSIVDSGAATSAARSMFAAQRLARKQRLAVALRLFHRLGFSDGLLGHVTVRDPEHRERFWVNPFGVHFGAIKASSLLLVDRSGMVLEGEGIVNPAAVAVHTQIHVLREDAVAIAHAHTMYGKSWAALGRPLDPINQEACCFYEDHALLTDYGGIALEVSEGQRIAEALARRKGIILQNHGLLTVGESVESAAAFFVMMDRCCQSQLLAEAAGKPTLIAPEVALRTRMLNGTEGAGQANFAPWYGLIVAEEPEVLE